MTDKELLELAAKAAGYAIDDKVETKDCIAIRLDYCNYRYWNPLIDKADCLQMEIDLNLAIAPSTSQIYGKWIVGRISKGVYQELSYHTDRQRASTMAAAEIGRNLSA